MATAPKTIVEEIPDIEELIATMDEHFASVHWDGELPTLDSVDDPDPDPEDDPSSNYGPQEPVKRKLKPKKKD